MKYFIIGCVPLIILMQNSIALKLLENYLPALLICIVKNMFKFVDKWGRGIRGKPITLIEVLICIGVVISVIVGVV